MTPEAWLLAIIATGLFVLILGAFFGCAFEHSELEIYGCCFAVFGIIVSGLGTLSFLLRIFYKLATE
jgi:ABC-type arginine transport system permease subunit